jgi:hypothetical protein
MVVGLSTPKTKKPSRKTITKALIALASGLFNAYEICGSKVGVLS